MNMNGCQTVCVTLYVDWRPQFSSILGIIHLVESFPESIQSKANQQRYDKLVIDMVFKKSLLCNLK